MAIVDESLDSNWQKIFEGDVRNSEYRRINKRRKANSLTELPEQVSESSPVDMTGLALSGGGIRSAAFSLGVLQAIDSEIGIKKIDILSTVSGGGYIGASVSVGMDALGRSRAVKYPSAKGDQFPYGTSGNDKSDNQAVGHIRDHSRYLMPRGFGDLLASMTVLIRGLCANLAVVLALILFAAGVTRIMKPDLASLWTSDFLGWASFPGRSFVSAFSSFAFTKLLLLFGAAFHIVWALWRSTKADGAPEFQGLGYRVSRLLIGLTSISAFLELQPFALKGLMTVYASGVQDGLTAAWWRFASKSAPYLASIAAVIAFSSKYLGDMIKPQNGKNGRIPLVKRAISKALLLFAALALPLIIWIVFLHFTLAADIKLDSQPKWLENVVRRHPRKSESGIDFVFGLGIPVG
jgi:Patatin-like phospholipase